jgi:type I restriction enzyme, S subunit
MSSTKWEQVALSEVLQLDLVKTPVQPSELYPMTGVLSFGRGLFEREAVEGGSTSYKYFLELRENHFVMSQLFGWEGALAVSSDRFAGRFVSPQFPTFVTDESRLDLGYLGYFAKKPCVWSELGTRTRGMGDRRRTLNPEALLACKIPLPPIEEQRRIVNRLDRIRKLSDEAIECRQNSSDKSEQLCRALLRDTRFGEPRQTPMRELVTLRRPDTEVIASQSYHFAGVYCFGRGVFRGQRRDGSEFAYKRLTQIHSDEFIYPKLMAWEGALATVPEECEGLFVSPEFPVFTINKERVLPEVLDVHFRSPSVWPLLSGASTGTNVRRKRLNPSDFLDYKFPLPDYRAQLLLRNIRRRTLELRSLYQWTHLESVLASILDRAFKGEL